MEKNRVFQGHKKDRKMEKKNKSRIDRGDG
jgi:hypothetical protein